MITAPIFLAKDPGIKAFSVWGLNDQHAVWPQKPGHRLYHFCRRFDVLQNLERHYEIERILRQIFFGIFYSADIALKTIGVQSRNHFVTHLNSVKLILGNARSMEHPQISSVTTADVQ